MSDEESVKILQPVSLAMREALLHLDTHDFGENKARNKRKSDKNGANSPEPLKKRKKNKKMDENSNRESKQKRTQFNSLSNLKSNKVKLDAIARTGNSKI